MLFVLLECLLQWGPYCCTEIALFCCDPSYNIPVHVPNHPESKHVINPCHWNYILVNLCHATYTWFIQYMSFTFGLCNECCQQTHCISLYHVEEASAVEHHMIGLHQPTNKQTAVDMMWSRDGVLFLGIQRSCTRGMVHNKIHLISPVVPGQVYPYSTESWPKTAILSFHLLAYKTLSLKAYL